jgi:hypothetical protein
LQIWPCLAQAVLRRSAPANPQDLRSGFSNQAHKCRCGHPESVPKIGSGQYATVKFGNNVAGHETILHQYFRGFLLYFKSFNSNRKTIIEIIYETICETIHTGIDI